MSDDRAAYYRREPRSLGAVLPLVLLLVSLLLIVQVWNLWTHGHVPSGALDPTAKPRPIAPAGDLAEDEKATIALFKQSSKSVVHITTSEVGRDFFTQGEMEFELGSGSGFLWDEKGHVVTNFHVIESAD